MSRTTFQLSYQISPIMLSGGLAGAIPGNLLPLMALTEAISFTGGLLQGNVNTDLDTYFAQFQPIPGSSLQSYQIGQYPFANQTVAANAVIAQPLTLSMEMICPATDENGYLSKLATMTALQSALASHIGMGGTFTVATPAYIYTNMILLNLRDITSADSKQKQMRYQWDFVQPLIATTDSNILNSIMGALSGGLPISAANLSWSGIASAVGSTVSGAVGSIIPSASNLVSSLAGDGSSFQTSTIAQNIGSSIGDDIGDLFG